MERGREGGGKRFCRVWGPGRKGKKTLVRRNEGLWGWGEEGGEEGKEEDGGKVFDRMPESPEVLPQKICENLSGLCPECLSTGSLVCNGHEVLVAADAAASAPTSGGSCRSVRGSKRPYSLESSDSRRCGNMEHAAKVSKCLGASTGGAQDESPASSNAQPLSDIPRIHRCCLLSSKISCEILDLFTSSETFPYLFLWTICTSRDYVVLICAVVDDAGNLGKYLKY